MDEGLKEAFATKATALFEQCRNVYQFRHCQQSIG